MKKVLFAFLVAMLSFLSVSGQNDTTVYFVNFYPGPAVYELEGHSAIFVEVSGQIPVAYNFGVFDFDSPNFIYRFVKGETDYMAVAQPAVLMLDGYLRQGRRVVAHELDFDSKQKQELIRLLETNVRPENRTYRYNYVKDNCATRPLRAVELAAGDSIILGCAPFEAQPLLKPTFRNVMRLYHSNYPWYQFGIDLALGSGIDYPIDRREIAFAPAELDRMLPEATVGGRKLVKKTHVVQDVPVDAAIEGPTPWYLTPLAVCWAFFFVAVGVTIRDWRRRRVTKWFDAAYFAVLGLTGCLLTFLVFVSVHEATSPNWLYPWLNPLCFIPTIFIWLKKCKTFLVCYQIVNFVVLFALCLLWYFLPQSANAAFVPLIGAEMLRAASYVYITLRNK